MADKLITVSIPTALHKLLEKRAKKSMMDINDLIVDILRRSMISYNKRSVAGEKTDDALVALFSRKGKSRRK